MNTSIEWNQGWLQDADMLDVIARGRQAELVQDARRVQTGRPIRSTLICLGRRLLQKASVAAMALQNSQWSM